MSAEGDDDDNGGYDDGREQINQNKIAFFISPFMIV